MYVQEHEWVVQPVNIQEYRFQDVVPCTEVEIHSQTHYTGTSHSTLHSLSIGSYHCVYQNTTYLCLRFTKKNLRNYFFVSSVFFCSYFTSFFCGFAAMGIFTYGADNILKSAKLFFKSNFHRLILFSNLSVLQMD